MTTRKLTHKPRQPVRDRIVRQAREIRFIQAEFAPEQKKDALDVLSKIARRLANERA